MPAWPTARSAGIRVGCGYDTAATAEEFKLTHYPMIATKPVRVERVPAPGGALLSIPYKAPLPALGSTCSLNRMPLEISVAYDLGIPAIATSSFRLAPQA